MHALRAHRQAGGESSCDTCPGIRLERSLWLKVSVEVTSGDRAQAEPVPTWARRTWRNPGERSRACGAEGLPLRWSTRKRMLLTLLASEDSAPLPGLLGALSEAHRPGWYECIVGSRSEDLDARGELIREWGPAYPRRIAFREDSSRTSTTVPTLRG